MTGGGGGGGGGGGQGGGINQKALIFFVHKNVCYGTNQKCLRDASN